MRKIAVITVGRSDYGILRPLLKKLQQAQDCELQLIAGGMHFHDRQGSTIREILADGIPVAAEIRTAVGSDDSAGMSAAFSEGVRGMGETYERLQPDLVVILGDRFEMFAAATAAVFARKPLAHLHGGELTLGAIDDVLRHSITKMSHLHFASAGIHAHRIMQMGEEAWRVHVCGALAIDNLHDLKLLSSDELQKQLGLDFEGAPLVVTFHPPTLEEIDLAGVAGDLIASLAATKKTVVITAPNADPGGELLHRLFSKAVEGNSQLHFVENLGTLKYFSLMKCAAAMIGNSSSGILEAASFHLPVVNIGSRQEGRLQPANVINCGNSRQQMDEAITTALSDDFKRSLDSLLNPYGSGKAADSIAEVLLSISLDSRLLHKQFVDWSEGTESRTPCCP